VVRTVSLALPITYTHFVVMVTPTIRNRENDNKLGYDIFINDRKINEYNIILK